MAVRVGTSGWSYPSGAGTWNGLFYPRQGSRRTRGFDELRHYADHFDTVEVNSTFYRPPTPELTSSWAARTPNGFDFSLKLYQKLTHPKMFREAALRSAPGSSGALLEALARVTQADIDEFKWALAPLAGAGRLGALLAQFPPSFKATPEARDYLSALLGAFRDYPVAVELRHRSWSDDYAETRGLLEEHHAAWAQIDEPKFATSVRQNQLPNVSTFYYMRLHGRNRAQWWHPSTRDERYNYLYSAEELREFSAAAQAAGTLVKKSYVYTNNHFSAKAVVNAVMLKAQLGQPVSGEYSPEIVERYPELLNLVRVAQPEPTGVRLFSE
jgi:uncharacterized protein YecE (DUF72 family)